MEADCGQFLDPGAATAEAEVLDVAGGRAETRLQAVERSLKSQLRGCHA